MKITKTQLKQIIKEEITKAMGEGLTPAGEAWLRKKRAREQAGAAPQAAAPTQDLDQIAATLATQYSAEQQTWTGQKAKNYPGQGPLDRLKKVLIAADEKGDMTAMRMLTSDHYNIGHAFKKAGVHGSDFVTLARKIVEKAQQ